jgi:hypothetical protein
MMKKRHSFVSNSSSSSYIISADISDVATQMLDLVIKDWGHDADPYGIKEVHDTWRKNLAKFLNRDDIKEGKAGIHFPSCNYDTYILYKNGQSYVATSWNHQWEDLEVFESSTYKGGGEDDEDQCTVYGLFNEENPLFWDVRDSKLITRSKEDSETSIKMCCPECYKKYPHDTFVYYYEDDKGTKYCDFHDAELVERPSKEESKEG